jgi:hypothetical protein
VGVNDEVAFLRWTMLNTESETMSGSPYIYDPESKQFVMRPSPELLRQPVADVADEPPPLVKPPPVRERRKLVMWLVSTGLFLVWLILLVMWTRQISPQVRTPAVAQWAVPEKVSKEELFR